MTTSWMERAKALMQSHGISQEDLAKELSCTRGAVGHYLTGRRTPSLEQLDKLARALETDPGWLLYGDSGGVRDEQADYGMEGMVIPLSGNIPKGLLRGSTAVITLPIHGKHCYAVSINVNDYEPRIHAGEAVLIDTAATPIAGDEVLLQYRPKGIRLHSLLRQEGDSITVDSIVGEKQMRTLTKRDYKFVHKIVAIFRPPDS